MDIEFLTLSEARGKYKKGRGKMHFGAGFSCCFEGASVHLLPRMCDEQRGYPPGVIAHDVLHVVLFHLTRDPKIAEAIDLPLFRVWNPEKGYGILVGYLSPTSEKSYNWGNNLVNCVDIEY